MSQLEVFVYLYYSLTLFVHYIVKQKIEKRLLKKNIMFHLDNWFQFSDNHFLTLSETLLLSK